MSDRTPYELDVLAAVRALGDDPHASLTGAELVGEGDKTEILIRFIDQDGLPDEVQIPLYSGMFRDSRGQMPPPSDVAGLIDVNMNFPPW
jgi:hypothetical protein